MAISETPTARQLAEATAQKLWQWVERADAEGRDVTGPLDPADLIEAAILDGRKELEAQLEQVQKDERDGWSLLNQIAEALRISDGSGEWDRTELLEIARVCNADDREELKARLASLTAALEKHGSHRPPCASQTWDHPACGVGTDKPCTCGLEAILKGGG